MKGKDFDDYLAEKQDFHTPRKAWKELEQDIGEMEVLFAVWKTKDGQIHMRASQSDSMTTLGILSVAKQMALDEMRTVD